MKTFSKFYNGPNSRTTLKILYNKFQPISTIWFQIKTDSSAASFLWLTISVDCFCILVPNSNCGILDCGTKDTQKYKEH